MALIRIEPITAGVRVYEDDHAAWDAESMATMCLQYRPNEPGAADVTLHSAVRPHTRATLRKLLEKLLESGLNVVYAHRRDGHRIPGGVRQADGSWRTDLAALNARCTSGTDQQS